MTSKEDFSRFVRISKDFLMKDKQKSIRKGGGRSVSPRLLRSHDALNRFRKPINEKKSVSSPWNTSNLDCGDEYFVC